MQDKKKLAKRIIVALDVDNAENALALIRELEDVEIFKIGLNLFSADGLRLLKEIQNIGKKVFLDLKLHDIPNTVAEAVKVGVRHRIHMMTIHASGGREMMAKAAEEARTEAQHGHVSRPLLLAVTVLTSLKEDNLREIGWQDSTLGQVLRLARLAGAAGMDGVVCSPQEVQSVKGEMGKDFLAVVPGIRPFWSEAHDQKRIMTPSLAFQKGADYIVIGRPIIKASSPRQAFWRIIEELNRPENAPNSKNRTYNNRSHNPEHD